MSATLDPAAILGGRYVIRRYLGVASGAEVYVADDRSLARQVAIHFAPVRTYDPSFVDRFREEAVTVAALTHPYLLRVFDWGEEAGGAYLVTEFPEGGSLRTILDRQGTLTVGQAALIGAEVAEGLAYAHARGIVHGSLAPELILFDRDGRARIAGLGLSEALMESHGNIPADPRYASPEQATGATVDARTDVYALSLVLFEAVTGYLPFVGETPASTLQSRVGKPLPVESSLGAMDMVVAIGAAYQASARPDAALFAQRLQAVATDTPAASSPSGPITRVSSRPQIGFRTPRPEDVTGAVATPSGPTPLGDPSAVTSETVVTGDFDFDDDDDDRRPIRGLSSSSLSSPASPRPVRRSRGGGQWVAAIVAAVVVVAAVGLGAAWKLGAFSVNHTVPTVVGLTKAQATTLLSSDGFTVSITGPVSSPSVPAGSVVSQTPMAGTNATSGATVSIAISGGPNTIAIPVNILGVDCATATQMLSTVGLTAICPLSAQIYSSTFGVGHVAEVLYNGQVNPSAVPTGSTVTLAISKGVDPSTTTSSTPGSSSTTTSTTTITVNPHGPRAVPNFVGMSKAQVFATAKTSELYYSTNWTSTTTSWHVVVSQRPAPGTQIAWHGMVHLTVR